MIIRKSIFAGSSSKVEGKPSGKAPEFAFIGRSNVGKSSLINMICGHKDLARTSSTPGKTLLINHFLVNDSWYLVDLPGYGFARISKTEQASLKRMIESYIGKSEELVTLFVLIDSRRGLMEIDRNFISALVGADVDFAIVLTKCDKLTGRAKSAVLSKVTEEIREFRTDVPVLMTSSEKGIGKEEITDLIENRMNNTKY